MAEAPRELLADPTVPWPAKAAAAAMWACCKREDEVPTFWPTFIALGERLGCTARQAKRAVWQLVATGWAARVDRDGKWVTVLHAEAIALGDHDVAPFEAEEGTTRRPPTGHEVVGDHEKAGHEMVPPRTTERPPGGPREGLGGDHEADSRSPKQSPTEAPTEAPGSELDDSLPPTKAQLEAWQSEDRFALSPPEPDPKPPKRTAEQRRLEQALVAWEANERHRRQTWPRTTGRQVTDGDLRAVVNLHKHVRKRLGCDEEAGWAEVERFAKGANEHAAAAERGETGDSPEWAAKLVRWRNDGQEWGRKRWEAWVGEQAAGPRKARRRGHARAEDQDHTEERF